MQAIRFRKQGRLQDEETETIIQELKRDIEARDNEGAYKEATMSDEQKRVMEAVNEGLLQVHGIALNSK